MSFRSFIIYCALGGAWGALGGWLLGRLIEADRAVIAAGIKGLWLGMLVAAGVGLVDVLWTVPPGQIVAVGLRVLTAVVVGGLGGFLGGFIGQILFGWKPFALFLIFGWTVTGLLIGFSVGAFDLLTRLARDEEVSGAVRKVRNGMIGGTAGGLLGGTLSLLLRGFWLGLFRHAPGEELWSPSALGFVALGACIGLLIGLAQVVLKEAWVRVEAGFRPGRELILSKAETTIGRAEGCDIGLFGDPTIERLHARILKRGDRYLLADGDTPGGTFLNDVPVAGPTVLRSGDLIRVGGSLLRFGERKKRTD
ncbi:MAG TPA: FHA domain-containing protein [Gemmataceae bacterium]|jgi:hypothetical protein|nr:FHA domain-containing protein [Gemmataceae bacterium]